MDSETTEHVRQLNRIRVARHRARKRNGGNDVMPALATIIKETKREVDKVVNQRIGEVAQTQLARILKEERCDTRMLVRHAAKKLEATEPWVLDSNGQCIDKPAHATQDRARDYLTARAHEAGELPTIQASTPHAGVSIQFHFHRPDSARTLDVVDDAHVIEATAVDSAQVCENKGD